MTLKNYISISLLLLIVSLFYSSHAHLCLDFNFLRYHHLELAEFLAQTPLIGCFILCALYIVAALIFFPQIPFLIALSGYFLPNPFDLLIPIIGLSLGSSLLFMAIPTLSREKDLSVYHLVLRIVSAPWIWIATGLIGFFEHSVWRFFLTCALGITPMCISLVSQGKNLPVLFENEAITDPNLKVALVYYIAPLLIILVVTALRQRKLWLDTRDISSN